MRAKQKLLQFDTRSLIHMEKLLGDHIHRRWGEGESRLGRLTKREAKIQESSEFHNRNKLFPENSS